MNLSELGKRPVPGEAPAGKDVRSEESFEKLQGEIDKLSTPSGDGVVDWNLVVTLSSDILANQSKDLLVACYLSAGLFETKQTEGFLPGLTVLADIVETYWENLFPAKRRMRGRRNAVQWWSDRLSDRLDAEELPAIPKESYDAIQAEAKRFDSALSGSDDEAPLLRPLIGRLERLAFVEPEPEPAPEPSTDEATGDTTADASTPKADAPAPSTPKPSPATAAAPAMSSVPAAPTMAPGADPMQVARDGADVMRQAALLLIDTNMTDPAGWRVSRLSHWFAVTGLPPATNGTTRIPAPPAQVKGPLDALVSASNYEGLAKTAEGMFHQYLYWLDLPRMVAQSLQALGATHADAHKTVCDMTAAFLATHAGVERLSFADGTPFADPATLGWIDDIALAQSGSGGGGGGEDIEGALKAASAKIGGGDFIGGVEAVQKIIANARSQRQRLLARVGLCELLVRAKKAKLAAPHLGQALADITHYDLEKYDPELALRGLTVAYRGYHETDDAELGRKAEELLDRIAMLDPAGAVRLFESTPS